MKVILCDLNPKLVAEWIRCFGKHITDKKVEVYCGDIFEHKAEAITSPSQSYGFMDGGIDAVYSKHFGKQLQIDLQNRIKELPMRELLVGQSLVIPTRNKEIPFLISSPTMRVPLNVKDTANPYLAFKSSLCAAKEYKMNSILCPGLGTLTGEVEEGDCARQMFQAYQDFFDKYPKYPSSINQAYLSHLNLVGQVNMRRNNR